MANRTLELQSSLLEKFQIVAPYLGFLGGFIDGGVFEQQLVAMHLYPLGTFDFNVRCRDSPLPGLLKWFLNRIWKKMTDRKELVEASEDQTWVIVPDVVKKEWNDVVKSSQELERAFQEEMEEDGWLIFPELALEKKYEDILELYGEESRPSGALNKRDNIFSAYSSEVKDLALVVRNLDEGLKVACSLWISSLALKNDFPKTKFLLSQAGRRMKGLFQTLISNNANTVVRPIAAECDSNF